MNIQIIQNVYTIYCISTKYEDTRKDKIYF